MLCGYLESHGIRATHDQGGIHQSRRFIRAEAMGGTAYSGRQEILVLAVDLERAQELLEEANA